MTSRVDGVRRGAPEVGAAIAVATASVVPKVAEQERPQPLRVSAAAKRLPRGRLDGVRRPVVSARVAVPEVSAPLAPMRLDVPVLEDGFTAEKAAGDLGSFITPAHVDSPASTQPVARSWKIPWKHTATAAALTLVAFGSAALVVTYISPKQAAVAQSDSTPIPTVSPTPTATPVAPGLQPLLDQFVKIHQGGWGIYVKDLQTGATASVNATKPMTSASLYKLFVAERSLAMVDAGQWKLTDSVGGGTGRNLEACLRVMINVSDNACGRALGTKLGWGKQDKALDLEGYTDTTLLTPQQTSARDVGYLLERLQAGTLLSAKSSAQLMGYLKEQKVNNRLPLGLPAGTIVAHKTGDLDGYVHDAGIVYGPKTDYLVVIMSGPWNRPASSASAHAELSKQLWQYFEQ